MIKQTESQTANILETDVVNREYTAPVQHARFGYITEIDEQNSAVRIDFEGNPFETTISAKLGRAFSTTELLLAVQNNYSCRIEFIGGDMALPIVTDIFFSIVGNAHELVLKAKSVLIEAEEELVIKSGNTSTRYSGRDNRITTNAKYISSNADKAQKLRGSTVSIN